MIGRKRFLRKRIDRSVDSSVETRDAILWDVLPNQRQCRCKVQGSNELVVAYYPENWAQTPIWLKPGNAVILRHTLGNRNRLEVAGNGQLVPTPIIGDASPAIANGDDAILTGCQLKQIIADLQMAVFVLIGTFRISGITYTLGPITMDDSTLLDMAMGAQINITAGVVALDTSPSAGQFRYDLISVGADLILTYTKGTSVTSNPVIPDVPAGKVKCGHILVIGAATIITQTDINRLWVAPIASTLTMVITDNDLAWTELSTAVTIGVVDQDGNSILQSGLGWTIELSIDSGNGGVSYGGDSSTSSVIGYSGDSSNEVVFTYTRDQLDPGDVSPVLIANMYPTLLNQQYLKLRDIGGDLMV